MIPLTLVIGNKNYSSWSLRPAGAAPGGHPLRGDAHSAVPARVDRSARDVVAFGKVPALHDGDIRVWDSLAICEIFNERFPDK
jgi:glutathione S-transferase